MSNSTTSSTATPQPGTAVEPDRIAGKRQVISAIDAEIIKLLKKRRHFSQEMAILKAEKGLPHTDLQQERRVIDRYTHDLGAYGASLAQDILRLSKA